MLKSKKTMLLFLIMTFLLSSSINLCMGQATKLTELENNLKKSLQFDIWQGKDKDLLNGINLSKLQVLTLSGAKNVIPKRLFFISQNKDGQSFVKYRSQWRETDQDFTEITLSFLNSAIEAHNFVFDQYILGSSLPLNQKENALDKMPIAGNVSFFKGSLFIRNNIVVKIHSEGAMLSRTESIAKEIDKLLLSQKSVGSYDNLKPRIEKDENGKKIIIEP